MLPGAKFPDGYPKRLGGVSFYGMGILAQAF
jgi:hypothetical protein